MEQIEIKSRFDSKKVLVSGKYENIKECLEKNRGADLQGADLQGADLRDADLRDADLQGAYLQGADLRDAYLRDADLQGADLRDADLRDAYLRGTDLRSANLRGTDLRSANLRGTDLQGTDLQDAKGYIDSHDFFQEVTRRQKVDTFTPKEWSILGQIIIHKLCWDSIRKRFNKSPMGIFKKLSKVGFGVWEEKYKEITQKT